MKLPLLLLFICCTLCATAQHKADTICPPGARPFYSLRGNELTLSQVWDTVSKKPIAIHETETAKTNYYTGYVFGFIGGFMIGYELGGAIFGKSINWAVMGGGAGCIGISIPFYIGAKKHTRKAVELYNKALQ